MTLRNGFYFLLASLTLMVAACNSGPTYIEKNEISLNGSWRFALDSSSLGIVQKWYSKALSDSVKLPGTLDENKKGIPNLNRTETMRLSRELTFDGMAWYQKVINIPENWNDKEISLFMERTKPTSIWIDTAFVGSNDNLLTEQSYDLSVYLKPGKHTLTILVNNGKGSVPDGVTGSHAWTEHTEGNWNGIIGRFSLQALNRTHIVNIQLYPDIDKRTVLVKAKIISNLANNSKAVINISAESSNSADFQKIAPEKYSVLLQPGENIVKLNYKMGSRSKLWSEFNPVFYKIKVGLSSEKPIDYAEAVFGMRRFNTEGTQFAINGTRTFLRGKHDACVFPLTGHPPMDVDGWRRIFSIAKSYGINFYRFHSWAPPKAAFDAADLEGIYLQPELPFWGSVSRDGNHRLNAFLLKEGENILASYGNHPSFVMFALGNELSGDQEVMKEFLDHFRSIDNRHLMAYGSNNYLGFRGPAAGEDYYSACRVGADTDTTFATQIRGSFSFADACDGGYINGRYPSTDINFSGAISKCTVPAVGTEVGQYQIYPNYDEIKKYKGVMKPWNFEVFRERLKTNNLDSQAKSFFRASGALSVICYKADIEMALRTPHFGGFHLLDLQDFPGQGTALVGILDAFMESKGLVTPEQFTQFCNRVVPLLTMKKYCWTNDEPFAGKIEVANYSESTLKDQKVTWELSKSAGGLVVKGQTIISLPQGELTEAADLKIDLSSIKNAEKLTLTLILDGTNYRNSYPVWVYPAGADTKVPSDIYVTEKLDKITLSKLAEGGKVLCFPSFDEVKDISVGGLFTPDYWNYRMFKGISESIKKPVSPGTMSILTDPSLPLFSDFPTEFHSNWQWWSVVKNSRPFILDNGPADYFPLVQVVDNIERNHKLGLIFEFTVGKGKILFCMSHLQEIQDKPEGKQLYSSILKYISSEKFTPRQLLTPDNLVSLFSAKAATRHMEGVKNISYQ